MPERRVVQGVLATAVGLRATTPQDPQAVRTSTVSTVSLSTRPSSWASSTRMPGTPNITAAVRQPSSVRFMITGAFRNGLLGRS